MLGVTGAMKASKEAGKVPYRLAARQLNHAHFLARRFDEFDEGAAPFVDRVPNRRVGA